MDHKAQAKMRLTSNYDRRVTSNVQKLIDLMTTPANDNEMSYELMLRMRDIDQATGPHLDMHGENAGLERGQMDDALYRALIKVKYLINQSNGSIPTLNRIFRAFLGDLFKGLQEGWNYASEEPAALVLKVAENTDLKWPSFLKEAIAGGVRLFYAHEIKGEQIHLRDRVYHFGVEYKRCNTFVTDPVAGYLGKGAVAIKNKNYAFEVHYPICNTFVASSISMLHNEI